MMPTHLLKKRDGHLASKFFASHPPGQLGASPFFQLPACGTCQWLAALTLSAIALIALPDKMCAQSWIDWRSKDNLAMVHASGVEKGYVLHSLAQPAGIFFPGEAAEIVLTAPDAPKESIEGASIELVGVHNRNAVKGEVGFVLVTTPPKVELDSEKPARVNLDNLKPENHLLKVTLPLGQRYGTRMIVLERKNGQRTFIGSVARALAPVERKSPQPQIMAESGVSNFSKLGDQLGAEQLSAAYERMGIKLVRWEFHWQQNGPDKPYDFSWLDFGIPALARHHIKLMNTMGAQPGWAMPMESGPVPAALHTENHISSRKFDAHYGKWVRALVERYWTGGESGLWSIEHYNEPWEPVSCAGWASDSCRYRELLEILSREAHSVAPGIKIAAACSVMNTEDKLTSDGSDERMKWIDLMTDHYVTPCNAYGPRVAEKFGKISGETETWGVCTQVLLPQFMTQFLAAGNAWVNPMTGDMPLEELGYENHPLLTPKPLVVAVAAWNAIVADRPFKRVAFTDHLPWLFQFGEDDDARFVLYGKAMPLASGNLHDLVWQQAAAGPDGTLAIADPTGELTLTDLEGNVLKPDDNKTYRVPLTPTAVYLQSKRGASHAIECVRKATIEGMRQVEIIPGSLAALPTPQKPATLPIRIHNLGNTELTGELKVASLLKEFSATFAEKLKIGAGESTTVAMPIASLPAGGLPLEFRVMTAKGEDTWKEVVEPTAIIRATLSIDGDAERWSKLPVVTVIRPEGNDTGNPIERAWLPFLEKRPGAVAAKHGEVRLAWDDDNLYLQASIESKKPELRDRFEGWDEDQYFYSAKCDAICESLRPFEQTVRMRPGNLNDQEGFKRFQAAPGYADLMKYLAEHPDADNLVYIGAASKYFEIKQQKPGMKLADASFVYIKDFAPQQPFNGDSFQFGFDLDAQRERGTKTHDLKYATTVPLGFQALPDTDYEFALYACRDGKSELMNLLSPGMPRVHIYPRQPRGALYPHAVKEARSTVTYENGRAIYRAALPWKAAGIDKPQAGLNFGFTFRFNASQGDRVTFGDDMAATKSNSLSLHPYWMATSSCTVRWTLAP